MANRIKLTYTVAIMEPAQFLLPRSIRLIRRDPLLMAPSIALGLLVATAQILAPKHMVVQFPIAKTMIFPAILILFFSELIRYITIAWSGQVFFKQTIVLFPNGPLSAVIKFLHLVLLLIGGIGCIGVLVIGGVFIDRFLPSVPFFFLSIGVVLVALAGVGIGLIALLAINFIIIESLPVWRAVLAAARMLRQSFRIIFTIMVISTLVALMMGLVSEIVAQVPVIGVVLGGIVSGIGSALSVLVQTIGFLDIRSRYRSVQ